MAKLASLALASVAMLLAFSGPAQGAAAHCKQVDVEFKVEGGGSGVHIHATNISCTEARKIVRRCIKGSTRSGWTAKGLEKTTLTSGKRKITFSIAGGGGCTPLGMQH